MRTCIFVTIKNEHLYLKEWLDAHFELGFDKVFILEDVGSRSHSDIADKYGDRVEVYSYNDMTNDPDDVGIVFQCRQDRAFEWFIDTQYNKGEFDWCLFTDVDEYLEISEGYNLESFLNDYRYFPGIVLYWKCYGANGHYKREHGSVVDLYKSDDNIIRLPLKYYTKIFVNLNYTGTRRHFWGVHTFDGAVSTDMKKVNFANNQFYEAMYDKAWINHYRTKSLEDWLLKLSRGFVHATWKDLDTFFEMNPSMDMETAKTLLPQLRNI